jgi:hypothetical protein
VVPSPSDKRPRPAPRAPSGRRLPSVILSTKNRPATCIRQARPSSRSIFCTDAIISAMDPQMNPVRPSTTTSGTDPWLIAMTGVPHAHGFNHRNPEWLKPVDGKEIRKRVPQKLVLLRFVNLSHKLNQRIPEQRLDLLGEILFVHGDQSSRRSVGACLPHGQWQSLGRHTSSAKSVPERPGSRSPCEQHAINSAAVVESPLANRTTSCPRRTSSSVTPETIRSVPP